MVGRGEYVGEPVSNFDRLRNLFNFSLDTPDTEVYLNDSEKAVVMRYWERRHRGIMCGLIRDDGARVDIYLMEDDRLVAIGFKGLKVKLGDSWIKIGKYVEIDEGYLGDIDETQSIANYMVDFVAKAISEKRIPEVEIPLKIAPRQLT